MLNIEKEQLNMEQIKNDQKNRIKAYTEALIKANGKLAKKESEEK